MPLFLKQTGALLKKEFIVWANTKSAIIRELLFPLFVAFLVNQFIGFKRAITFIAIYLPISLAGFIRGFSFEITYEKAEKFKEYLRINGVQVSTYYFSWIVFGVFRCFLASVVIMIGVLLSSDNPFTTDEFFMFWFTYLLFAFASISLCLALTSLFSSPKLASDIIGLIYAIVPFLYIGIAQNDTAPIYNLTSFLPQLSLIYALVSQVDDKPNMPDLRMSTLYQALNIIIYFSLFVLIDNFVPDEFGIKRKCCKRKKKRQSSNDNVNQSLKDPLTQMEEDISSARFHQPIDSGTKLKRALVVSDLRKNFGGVQVIKGVTFMIYTGQVYCLLGHNGAGKTTTINILTGILEPEEGEIYYGNMNFSTHFVEVRKTLGFCAQKDILYDDLTVEDHLRMIGIIRGIAYDNIEAEVKKVAKKVGLYKDRKKKARTLSGGNKRKLCLGMATIGSIRVVFLDEPTSGLDANSRRGVWEVIRNLKKEGVTIILTTHHLDEADELADRIAILSKGTLHSVGTAQYLKRQFGAGYQLLITPKYQGDRVDFKQFERKKPQIKQIVCSKIPNNTIDEKTPPEVMKFSLPFSETEKFGELFEALEAINTIEVSLEMNSLEDAFINIGLEEETHEIESKNVNLTEIEVPKSINKNPEYRFMDQFRALLKRKFLCFIRSWMNIVLTVFPVTLIVVLLAVNKVGNLIPEGQTWAVSQTFNLAFALNAGVYCGFPVNERQFRLKYALKVMGCRTSAYWIGTFFFDFVLISLMMTIFIVCLYILGIETATDNMGLFLPGLIFYGASLVTGSYMWGFAYQKSQSAYKTYSIFCLGIMYYIPFWIGFLGQRKDIPWLTYVFKGFGYVSGPFLLMQDMMLSFSSRNLLGVNVLTSELFIYPLLLLAQTVIFFALTLFFESRKYNIQAKKITKSLIPYKDNAIFDAKEINNEATRVQDRMNEDQIKTLNLRKTYDNGFQAVRGISFGVAKKQIFGLLGPNGAGKSTTFGVLTALERRTSGSVQLMKSEIDSNMHEIFKEVGVCPQFDCLWDDLTPIEHLEIFGSMKGLRGNDLREIIDYYVKAMQLTDHVKKKSKFLSGGNKRKLCVTDALIGSPSLQFFDEPSTGLDPVARRYLYDTLVNNLNNRDASIILTTHSLTEAEMLCNKIGIIINGKFVCIGSTSYLKNKYGTGYRIIVPSPGKKKRMLEAEMRKYFPTLEKVDTGARDILTFQLPKQDFRFSEAFKTLEEMKAKKVIPEYSLMNTTLEQIFLSFSKFQEIKEDSK